MRRLITALCLLALTLVSCGGNDNSLTGGTPTTPGPGAGGPDIASVEIITNNPQIPSDGGIPAVITAFIKDSNNNFVAGADVSFSASSGGLVVTQATTDANGTAIASLTTAGDPTNRIITVTATSGTLSETINVNVTGTQLTVSGPANLVQGDTATYTIVLINGAGEGIAGETITVSSTVGNTLAATTLTTDATGQAQVNLTATIGGMDSLTASGLGLTASRVLSVSNDSFVFNTPAANAELPLNTDQVFTVTWQQGGLPQAGESVSFSTTRGVFVGSSTMTTNGSGQASVTIRSNNAGPAIVTADAATGPTTQLELEFVATTPASIELQADPFTVAPNNQATITAIIRDAANNRVKNARVIFTLEDITGGTLSVGVAETDSLGRAQTFYTASDAVSGNLAVIVTGTVEVNPGIFNSVNLTVARRELFIAFGTGNDLIEPPDLASYQMPFLAIVTDSEGNGVPDVTVQFDVRSTRYSKGYWVPDATGDFWTTFSRVLCIDEDQNGNGILDGGEIDENNNGTIEAGNVVEVFPGEPMTDMDGKAIINLLYPKVYGAWTEVSMRALINVAGTEFSEDSKFVLPVLADDVKIDVGPPGIPSFPDPMELGFNSSFTAGPWGYGDSCAEDF